MLCEKLQLSHVVSQRIGLGGNNKISVGARGRLANEDFAGGCSLPAAAKGAKPTETEESLIAGWTPSLPLLILFYILSPTTLFPKIACFHPEAFTKLYLQNLCSKPFLLIQVLPGLVLCSDLSHGAGHGVVLILIPQPSWSCPAPRPCSSTLGSVVCEKAVSEQHSCNQTRASANPEQFSFALCKWECLVPKGSRSLRRCWLGASPWLGSAQTSSVFFIFLNFSLQMWQSCF